MSYTPTTWVTGDTITATKLNNMEQGIANAGNVALFYFPNSTVGWQVAGIDFATAFDKLTNGELFIAFVCSSIATNHYGGWEIVPFVGWSNSPDKIWVYFSSATYPYLEWTSNGIEYYD